MVPGAHLLTDLQRFNKNLTKSHDRLINIVGILFGTLEHFFTVPGYRKI